MFQKIESAPTGDQIDPFKAGVELHTGACSNPGQLVRGLTELETGKSVRGD